MTSPADRLTVKLAQLPISDDAPLVSLLRTTLLDHVEHDTDITEPALLGLLAITGVLEERLTRLEAAALHSSPTP